MLVVEPIVACDGDSHLDRRACRAAGAGAVPSFSTVLLFSVTAAPAP